MPSRLYGGLCHAFVVIIIISVSYGGRIDVAPNFERQAQSSGNVETRHMTYG